MSQSLRRQRLHVRRERLMQRSAVLRDRFAVRAQMLQTPLAMADQAVLAYDWLRRHPEWPFGAAVVVAVVRPRIVLRWVGRGWAAWRLWRRLRPLTVFWRERTLGS